MRGEKFFFKLLVHSFLREFLEQDRGCADNVRRQVARKELEFIDIVMYAAFGHELLENGEPARGFRFHELCEAYCFPGAWFCRVGRGGVRVSVNPQFARRGIFSFEQIVDELRQILDLVLEVRVVRLEFAEITLQSCGPIDSERIAQLLLS